MVSAGTPPGERRLASSHAKQQRTWGSSVVRVLAAVVPDPPAADPGRVEMAAPQPIWGQLAAVAGDFGLPDEAAGRLAHLLELVADEPSAITAIRDPSVGVAAHVVDSLDGLRVAAVRDARVIADLGSGAGFPGLVLAVARPAARVALVESVNRKAAFLSKAASELGLQNTEVVRGRAEAWRAGLGAQELVTARALAALPILVEYAAPLLVADGHLVAWKGRRDRAEEADGDAAAKALGMERVEVVRVPPRPSAAERHLHVFRKVTPTPPGYPRREGMARKRPLGLQRKR